MTTRLTAALYRRLTTDDLRLIRQAFKLDAKRPDATDDLIAFCQRRIRLIDQVLTDRRVVPDFDSLTD